MLIGLFSCVSRLRNVSFEITATEVGVFDVSAKFMGVSMEKVELIFQVGSEILWSVRASLPLYLLPLE